MVTYGSVSMKDEWKEYLSTLLFEKEFLHRDEFHEKFPALKEEKLPAIFISKNNILNLLVSSGEINRQRNITDLKNIISAKIKLL